MPLSFQPSLLYRLIIYQHLPRAFEHPAQQSQTELPFIRYSECHNLRKLFQNRGSLSAHL
jgi:hypothetical protein